MEVEIRCYGDVRGAVGESSIVVSVDEETASVTVDAVLAALDGRIDDNRTLPNDLIVMRDRTHVDRETIVADGDVFSLTDPPMPEG